MIVKKALEKDAEKIVSINIETWNKTYNGIFSKNVLEDLYNKKQEKLLPPHDVRGYYTK